jgi:membrane-bound lytic murein transglycosylase
MTHIVRALVPLPAAILVLAGCAGPPPVCPACPTPPRAAEAKMQQVPFAAIPGWANAPIAPGLRAFAAGCARIAAASALRRACEGARALRADDEAAARAYVEATLEPWAIASAEGAADGMVTGYYEPILAGSRARSAASAIRCMACRPIDRGGPGKRQPRAEACACGRIEATAWFLSHARRDRGRRRIWRRDRL